MGPWMVCSTQWPLSDSNHSSPMLVFSSILATLTITLWLLSTCITTRKLIIKHFTLNTKYSFQLAYLLFSSTKTPPILVVPLLLSYLDFMVHHFSNPLTKLNTFALIFNRTNLPKPLPWMNLTICLL